MIHSRSSAEYIKSEIMKNADGIKQSKTQSRSQSEVKGQNGHALSTKAHSISSTQALRSTTNQYINFVKENYAGKIAGNINNETALAFLNSKRESITGGSLNTMISTIAKMADNLNALGINAINRKDITDHRKQLKATGTNLQSKHINRAYRCPNEIVSNMNINTPYSLSCILQAECGLRAGDCINSKKWTINQDNSLHVKGSKGGINYNTKPMSEDLADRVREAIKEGYKIGYNEYLEAFKENIGNNKYHGTHGLRFNFCQERVEELKSEGYTESEALSQTSLEMGHSREEISNWYRIF